jgi:hypothetical protein
VALGVVGAVLYCGGGDCRILGVEGFRSLLVSANHAGTRDHVAQWRIAIVFYQLIFLVFIVCVLITF